MTDLEDDLQRMLATRAGEVEPQLTGAGIRALAASRRGQRLRTVGLPAAGTVLAAALLITPFILIHTHDSPARPGQVIVPAGSGTPSPTRPALSPASHPPLTTPSRPQVQSPTLSPSASLAPQPSSTGFTAPPPRPTAVPSGSPDVGARPTPTPTR